jgi:hypothetical protein
MYICVTIGTCCTFQLTVSWPANRQMKRTTRTNCCMYTLLPPGEEQLASPKHVVVE